jgi:hypothetical protein
LADRLPAWESEGTTKASPAGTARVESMLETVGLAIFVALLVGAAIVLIQPNRRR